MLQVIKKDGTSEPYDFQKIVNAVSKSASRVMVSLSKDEWQTIQKCVEFRIEGQTEITIQDMHNLVEAVLEEFDPKIAKSYKDYRNYKKDFVHMMDDVYKASQSIRFLGDKENSNTDSALVATKDV